MVEVYLGSIMFDNCYVRDVDAHERERETALTSKHVRHIIALSLARQLFNHAENARALEVSANRICSVCLIYSGLFILIGSCIARRCK